MALTTIKTSSLSLGSSTIPSANVTTLTTNNVTVTGSIFQSNIPLVLNDISTQFDGLKTVFSLLIDQTSINTIVDSKDLQVTINGQILAPYVKEQRYPWLTPYDSFPGYKVSGGNLIIYNAPSSGDRCVLIYRNTSQTIQTRKYPYSATSIALGD